MANFKVGQFTSTITGADATVTLGFQAKIFIAWTAMSPAYDTYYVETEIGYGYGYAPNPVPVVFAAFQTRWNDFWNAPNANGELGNGNIIFLGGSANYSSIVRQSITINSVTATEVVLRMQQNFNSELMKYDYVAIGGSDVEVGFGNGTTPTSTGIQAIAHGLASTPSCAFLHFGHTDDNTNGYAHSFGFTDGTNQAVTSLYQYGNGLGIGGATSFNPSVSKSYQKTTKCLIAQKAVDGSIIVEAGISSIDGTNINLNFTTAYTSGLEFKWLAIAGVTAFVGAFNQRTTTGTTTVNTNGVNPHVVIGQSWGIASSGSVQTEIQFSHFVTDGDAANQFCRWNANKSGVTHVSNMRYLRRHDQNGCLFKADLDATTSATLEAQGTLEFDPLNEVDEFVNDWTTVNAVASEWVFLALGTLVPGGELEMTMSGGLEFNSSALIDTRTGLLKIVPGKRSDTYNDLDTAIPNPFAETSLDPTEDM